MHISFDSGGIGSISRAGRYLLLCILIGSTLIKLILALTTEIYVDEGGGTIFRPLNDEYAHFKYIQYLAEQHRLPINSHIYHINDSTAWIFQDFEYAQPPLYYLLNLPAIWTSNPVLAARILSILLGIATLLLAIKAAFKIFCEKERAAILIAALIAFHPIFLRVGSSISNDNLAWFLSSLLFLLFLNDQDLKHKFAFGLLVAAGILTKVSMLIWLLFLVSAVLLTIRTPGFRARLLNLMMICIIVGLCSAWLFLRNHSLYDDWSGIAGGSGPPGRYLLSGSMEAFAAFANGTIRYLFYPIAEEPAPLLFLAQVTVCFFVLAFFVRFHQIRETFNDARIFQWILLFTTLNLLLYINANLRWDFSEARHLFVGLLPLSAIAVAVLLSSFSRFATGITILVNLIFFAPIW